jgi:signal transduction histidine kinase
MLDVSDDVVIHARRADGRKHGANVRPKEGEVKPSRSRAHVACSAPEAAIGSQHVARRGMVASVMSAAAAESDPRRQLKHVTDLVRALPSVASPDEVLREVARAAAAVRRDGACAIHLLDEATGAWTPVRGACQADLVAPAVTRTPGGAWDVSWSPHLDARAGVFAVAIVARDVLFGVVLLQFDPALPLADDDREMIELLAAEAALALHIHRLHESNAQLFASAHAARAAAEATEHQLREAQKMEAVGLLAGGIAHDFNNLLTIISGRAQLLAERPLTPEAEGDVDIILNTSDRAAILVRQLLAFGRRQMVRPKVLDLNDVVRGVASLLHRVIGEDIELVLALAREPSPVLADAGQLEQALMNLAINARDAMPGGGRLTIASAEVVVDEALASRHIGATPGAYVRLSMTDVGHGMDETTRARAFDPFFTTKPAGKGTGLGLPTVYGIVRHSGGFVDLESAPGSGTTFRIYLPRAGGRVEPATPPPPPTPAVARGAETVLVVEDDDDVRAITCQILIAQGYTVLEAADVEDAVRLAEEHAGPIHLLLTDVVMPRMSGPELAQSVRQRRPETAVLYVSGYTDDTRIVTEPQAAFLEKPFQVADLVRAVRARLGPSL